LAQFNDLKAEYYMLMLRRHEKDYLLRKDLKYKDEFSEIDSKFTEHILHSNFEKQEKLDFLDLLSNYKSLFFKIIEQDFAIGINNSTGLLSILNEQVVQIEQVLSVIQTQIYDTHKKKVNKTIASLFIIIFTFSIGIVLLIFKATQIVIKPLNTLKRHIRLLGEGHLPESLHIAGKNELAEMTQSLNILTENLKNTKEFAIEVGKGKLDTQINVFNNQGDLGGSLIQMRNELIKVAQEREIQNTNHQNRIWANQTLNEINELLRTKNTDIEELSYQILSTLIKQTESNQGALFLKSETENDVFEVSAIQAYGRKKFLNKKIVLGEDLVGTCAIEKETIYMTDIPKEYIQISSGLGFANPSSLVLVPMKSEEQVIGVIEIASFKNIEKHQIEIIEKAANNYASALYIIKQNKKTQELLEASNFQTNELEAQSEELRQNMEELSAIQEALNQNEEVLKQRMLQLEEEKNEEVNELNEQIKNLKQHFNSSVETLNLISNMALFAELSPTGAFISASKKLIKTLHLTPSELYKKSVRDFMKIDEQIDFELDWQRILTGELTENMTRLYLKNGKQVLLYNYFSILRYQMKVEKVFVFSKLMNADLEKTSFKEMEGNVLMC
jgi:PAS domain-containing protein